MRLRDKQTGKVDEYYISNDPSYGVINARTGTFIGFNTLAELCARFEDAPEEIKPFEEVAKATYKVEMITQYLEESAAENERRGVGFRNPKCIKIADQDYYEILPDGTKKTTFTWDEATEIEKKTHGKWRMPTQAEWYAIATAFGTNADGRVTGVELVKNLELVAGENGGNYWTSTTSDYGFARGLGLYKRSVYVSYNYEKADNFNVRCVAGEGE